MTRERIVKAINDKRAMISLSRDKEARNLVEKETEWLNGLYGEVPLRIRCLVIQHGYNINSIPKCELCGKPASFNRVTLNSFNRFCSAKCRQNGNFRLKETAYVRLNDREWLLKQRIEECKSYSAIGKELGCSFHSVKEACRKLNIPLIRHNESNPMTLCRLRDKDWLADQHIAQRKTLETIATEIGSTKATVSRWFSYHDIQTNESNSYPRKFNHVSDECSELVEYIQSLGENVQLNNRSILNGKEIDILVYEKRIAIEYNGIYSHVYRPEESKPSIRKGPQYHLGKTLDTAEKGYQLLHIFSDDWLFKKDIWKSILAVKLGKAEKIAARKCRIIQPSKEQKVAFLRENHLQGKDFSTIYYGLEYDGELVAVMTFGRSRYRKGIDWELSRYAAKKNIVVVGGFSRLLNVFRKGHAGSIISYADRSRSDGGLYVKNGFRLLKINRPGYHYVNFNQSIKRMHRANFRKSRIAPDDPRPEPEIMLELGYRQIWDCGTLAFILEKDT